MYENNNDESFQKIFLCKLNKGQLPTHLMFFSFTFYIPLKFCTFFRELGNETYTYYHFNLKAKAIFKYNRKYIKSCLIREYTHKKRVFFSGRTTKGVGRLTPPPPITKQKKTFFL